jgi:hypothetical protein
MFTKPPIWEPEGSNFRPYNLATLIAFYLDAKRTTFLRPRANPKLFLFPQREDQTATGIPPVLASGDFPNPLQSIFRFEAEDSVTFLTTTCVPRATPEEKQGAEAMGVSVEVYRLQQRLRKLPLLPREQWLRDKRAKLVADLYAVARRDRCIPRINPFAATEK